ncbi:hypothetical protein RhiirC2_795202 [Rhizophagus irregularis]|uniref:Uncharacterized protein n=1 Tax=Rhizophagus irregularis TaxID=588596 RepID=A0A2N1MC30_9GLOM|nr:hypothetical protein RhiirC2_795202 [Rhizophagus irregularis]
MAFNQAYSELLAKLPASIINEIWIRLTSRKRNPLSEKEASEINPIVESWPECPTSFKEIPCILVTDNGSLTNNITCNHEEENNRWVMNELKVLSQHLLDYNRRTFGKFMQDIEREYRERISMNKKLRCENEDLKMQLREAEKELASMKLDSSH